MSIVGVIEDVLETFPLQLTVVTDGGRRQVALRRDTAVERGREAVEPGQLRPGQRVRIEATRGEGGSLAARTVEILAEAPAEPPAPAASGAAEPARGGEADAAGGDREEFASSEPLPFPPAGDAGD